LDKKIGFICVAVLVVILICMWMPLSIPKALGETYITVYIRSDGSVEPSNAPISTVDKHYYKLTSDLLGSIVIERSGIVFDGGGHVLAGRVAQGYAEDKGLVIQASNVVITGFKLQGFSKALVIVDTTSVEVNKCTIIGNWMGVYIDRSSKILVHNNTMRDNAPSIYLVNSTYVEASRNIIEGRGAGIIIKNSSSVYIHTNAIHSKARGVVVEHSDMVYIGGNKVVAPNGIGVSVENSLRTYVFNNSLVGEEADSCNIHITDSEKTFIHKNLLQYAPSAVDIEGSSKQIVISYNHIAGKDPHTIPTILLNNSPSNVVIYGNEGEMRIEPHNTHGIIIQNNTNVAIDGDTSSLLTICINIHTTIELKDVYSVYICGNMVDYGRIAVSGSNITIHGNIVKNYRYGGIGGIQVYGDFIKVYENEITNNTYGVSFSGSHFEIYGNNITYNTVGLLISGSSRDVVVYNNIIAFNGGDYDAFCNGPGTGVCIYGPNHHNITFYHNSFINNHPNNEKQVYLTTTGYKWDSGYPSGGNYWSDYTGIDQKKGVKQDEPGSDGIGDTPYQVSIYPEELDRYPLIKSPPYPIKGQLTLSPPPNIVVEPPSIRISTPTPTPTSTTPTKTTYTTTTPLPSSTTSPTTTTSLPSTHTATITTTTTSTPPAHTTTPQTMASPTTTQGISGTATTTITTPQKAFDATMLIAASITLVVIGIAAVFLLRKRMV